MNDPKKDNRTAQAPHDEDGDDGGEADLSGGSVPERHERFDRRFFQRRFLASSFYSLQDPNKVM